jgi:glycogen operon protein
MGDEVRRTQRGNNNAYCHDDATSWFDWEDVERHAGLLRFVRELVDFCRGVRMLEEDRFWTVTEPGQPGILGWHGVEPDLPDWTPRSHALAYTLDDPASGQRTYVALNAFWRPLTFTPPAPPAGRCWRRIVDTSRPSPRDVLRYAEAPRVARSTYRIAAHTVVVLQAEAGNAGRK